MKPYFARAVAIPDQQLRPSMFSGRHHPRHRGVGVGANREQVHGAMPENGFVFVIFHKNIPDKKSDYLRATHHNKARAFVVYVIFR